MLLCVIAQVVMAQGKVISGTVEDAMGPVMMANVTERDANNRIVNATQTDMMGNFSMEIKNPKNKLVVSYVGSKTYVAVIGDKSTFEIKLEDEKTTLNEITVKGRRGNSGGLNINKNEIAVSQQTFNLSDVEGMAFTSVDEALQGEIAGLDIVSNSGNLASGSQMRLRGVSSINGDSEPLIVVDDKIFEYNSADIDLTTADEESFSSLLSVNVDDIASITVLKDAAATAIWGSKGANGVIQITTKRGTRSKPRFTANYKFTGTWMPSNGYTLLNGDQYTMMLKEAIFNTEGNPEATQNIKEINYDKSWIPGYYNWSQNIDWIDNVKQFGDQHEINMNLTGGGEKASFRISAGYKKQAGTTIKTSFNQLTTRLSLTYFVSDRITFDTRFALTYNDNYKNYSGLVGQALRIAPNSSIYRYDVNGNMTNDYFLMNPVQGSKTAADGDYTSYQLGSVYNIGNPVAYANLAWSKQKNYTISPDFQIKYDILGTGNGQTRLTLDARVYFDILADSSPNYFPASLVNGYYYNANYNQTYNKETNTFKTGARLKLTFTPHFKNEDFFATMYAQYDMNTARNSLQEIQQRMMPTGIESPTIDAVASKLNNQPGTVKSASQSWMFNSHFSYKERYVVGFTLRADNDSRFGPKNPWFYSPAVNLRYNVSDEKFFKPLRKVVSMLGIRGSFGVSGSMGRVGLSDYYNQYTTINDVYGSHSIIEMSGMKLDDIRPEKTTEFNFGLNLGLLDDKLEFDFNLYRRKTIDLLMQNIPIPSSAAWNSGSTVSWGNVGSMENKGWELKVDANRIVKVKKFSASFGFNIYQNSNKLLEMDERILKTFNTEPNPAGRGYNKDNKSASNIVHVVVGDPMSSIYGYNFKGVYQYKYEFLSDFNASQKQKVKAGLLDKWTTADYERQINTWLAEGKTFPVVVGEDGKVIIDNNTGEPQRLKYDANGIGYNFQGGDAIYEDVNHDGSIDKYDYQYLGNSLPKLNAGFHIKLEYGNWKVTARFNARYGNKIVNIGRMNLENMYGTDNQCASVNYRWRKDGDVTVIPRALYNTGYNYQISSRNVEDGSFLRFTNLQLSYAVPKKSLKKYGMNSLTAAVTVNNLFCWTKYTGIDPEMGAGTYTPAYDLTNTPKYKSVTASLTFGF